MAWAVFNQLQYDAVQELAQSGSDRVVAVIGGAILDENLAQTLKERFRDDKDISNRLFKVSGALGNMVPKIDLAYQLYAIDKPLRTAMYGLSDIRNHFAHRLDASFDSKDKKMLEAMGNLKLHEGLKVYPHHQALGDSPFELEPISNNRDKFLVNLQLALTLLMRDRSRHVLWSNYSLPGWPHVAPDKPLEP